MTAARRREIADDVDLRRKMDSTWKWSPLLLLLWMQIGRVTGGTSDNAGEAPHITEQPLDVTVARHQPATLNCRAGGTPTPTVQWYKAGVLVAPDAHTMTLPAGALFFLRASHGRSHTDAGVYWCEATNVYGTARSRNATLHVAILRDDFRLEPSSTQTAQGETVLLECSPPRGSPEPTVFWRRNGETVRFQGDSRMHLVDGGSLVIQDARQSDAGTYQCVARNAAGSRESVEATLSIHIKPYLITGPDDVIAHTGGSVTFQCRVGGDPLPDILWRRAAGGGNMPLGRVKVLDDRSLRLEGVTIADEGEYTCEADNSVGAVSATGYLTVHDPPTISMQKMLISVEVGSEVMFECSATGRPDPTMFWSLEGNRSLLFPGETRGRFHASIVVDGVTTLTINETYKNDSGVTVVCSAVNDAGSTFVRGKLRITSEDDRPPPIILHGPCNQTLPLKSVAVFPCSAIGEPQPVVSWYHEGLALVQNHRRNISDTGTLTLRDLEKSDSGSYTCVAASQNGKYVWSGTLRVDAPTNPNLNFFRAPDVSTLPGAPSKPRIINATEASITISWTQHNKIGSSSLIGYQVEMFAKNSHKSKNSNGWIKVARKHQETHFTAKHLTPGLTYLFLVRSENSHGLSGPSILSEPMAVGKETKMFWDLALNNTEVRTNLMTDDIIELIEATPIDSATIKVLWEVLNFLQLEGIFIYYRALSGENSWADEYQMKTILHSNDVSGFEVTGLNKFTKYEFFLIPFYKHFEGKPSNSKVARTLDDAPSGPPTDIEMSIMNSTTVHLKWSLPKKTEQNGQITSYNVLVNWLDPGLNKSVVAINTTVQTTSLIMANLSFGVTYSVQVSASTVVGSGPYSTPVYLNIESRSIGLDPFIRYPTNSDVSIVADDFVMETWLILLIGAIGVLKIALIGAIIFFKKNNLFTKKASLPNIYDSNGTSLVTQMNIKAAVSLSHPLNSCYNKTNTSKADSLLWMDNKPGNGLTNRENEKNPEYDRVAQPLPEYAEVTCARPPPNEWNTTKTQPPAAYASVTLVANTRQCVSSLGWFSANNKKRGQFESRFNQDEELYPASNGGYYNRNVYADKYIQGQPNVIKFYDIPSLDGKKAQLRYNTVLDVDQGSNDLHRAESLTGRTYVDRKHSQDDTYKTFGVESDEDNYLDDETEYDNVRAMEPLRIQNQYERPTFDNDTSRTGRLSSFRQQQRKGQYAVSAPNSTYCGNSVAYEETPLRSDQGR